MLSVSLNDIGKRYGRNWIFRHIHGEIKPGGRVAILGGNGSGKSTLLQIIAGYITATEGKVSYSLKGSQLQADDLARVVSFASPSLQLIEEFTLAELVRHCGSMKPFLVAADEIPDIIGLSEHRDKLIRAFSSGMKQRVKIALALLADVPMVLLDEPVSHLDGRSVQWYRDMIDRFSKERTFVVCSNAIKEEYAFCDTVIYTTPVAAQG